MIAFGIYITVGFLLSTLVERKPAHPLGMLIGFIFVVLAWPYVLWRSIREANS